MTTMNHFEQFRNYWIGDHKIQCIDLDLKLKKDPCQ